MIRVLIVDDQVVVSEGLRAILSTAPGITVTGTATDGAEALARIAADPPDVALMDLKMPGMNGIHATRAIRQDYPAVRVLVLTTYDADEWVYDAIRAGAAGYLLKDSPRDAIITAIERVAAGQTPIDPAIGDKVFNAVRGAPAPDSKLAEQLSERERDILELVALGHTNAEIAVQLYLAEGTVRNYVSALLDKLGVDDRTQAAALAWQHGLVNPRRGE